MASLPVLTPLAELIKGTVTEEFKKLLQPAPLVAAAILLALNLATILPVLVQHGIPPFADIQMLPTVWQGALGTLTLLVLGYLIGSLKGVFLGLLTGDAFRASLVYGWLKRRQEVKFADLETKLKGANAQQPITEEQKKAAYRLAYQFPREEEELAPTCLGNALRSVASYTWWQHGAHLDTLWPLLDPLLEEKDKELHARVSESRNSLVFLASIAVLLAVAALEHAVVGLVFLRPRLAILGTLPTLAAAYVAYRATTKQALTWGRNVRAAFDLHLDDLAEELGLRALPKEEFENRQERWRNLSAWLAYGAVKVPGFKPAAQDVPDWFRATLPAPVFEVKHPPTVSVESQRAFRSGDTPDWQSPNTRRFYGPVTDYVFVIANTQDGEHAITATGVHLMVADSKMLPGQTVQGEWIVAGKAPKHELAECSQGDPPTLFWSADEVKPWDSLVLRYTARCSDQVIVELVSDPPTHRGLCIKSLRLTELTNTVRLEVRNAGPRTRAKLTIGLPQDPALPTSVHLVGRRNDLELTKTAENEIETEFNAPGNADFGLRFVRTLQ